MEMTTVAGNLVKPLMTLYGTDGGIVAMDSAHQKLTLKVHNQ
jgi:hypothetical protein